MRNNCFCVSCRKFFTNTETFAMLCPDCLEDEEYIGPSKSSLGLMLKHEKDEETSA